MKRDKTMQTIRRLFVVGAMCTALGIPTVGVLTGAPPAEIPSATYPVEHLSAAVVAARVQELLEASGLNAELIVDRSTNRLVARGSEEAQRTIRQAIGALDIPAAARAAESSTLQPVVIPLTRLEATATAMQLKYANDSRIRVGSDKRTSQLLIMAPKNMQESLRAEAQSIAGPAATGVQTVSGTDGTRAGSQKFILRNISWQLLEDRLAKLSGDRPVVTTRRNGEVSVFQMVTLRPGDTQVEIDRRSNEITVTAPEPALGGWKQTMTLLDRTTDKPGEVMEAVRLVNAEPAPIQKALRLLRELPQGRPTAAVAATAPQRMKTQGQATRPVVLQDPGKKAPDLNAPAQNATQPPVAPTTLGEGGAGVLSDVEVQFIQETGQIILKGPKASVQRVMEMIKQIEQLNETTQPEVKVQILTHINAGAAATLVEDLYDDQLAARQGQVKITSLDSPNAVLLVGRKEAVESVVEILVKLDQPTIPSSEIKIFELKNASAVDAETTVRAFFTTQPGEDEDLRPGLGTRARVVADRRTNSLIVQAAPRDLMQVAEIIEKLDVDKIPSTQQVQVFRLKNSIASELVTTLQAAIAASEDGEEGLSVPNAKLSILSIDKSGNRVLDSAILTGAVITSDSNSNSVIVRAPSASMPLFAELINQLDQTPGGQSTIKVFAVQNGDATSLVTTLQQLFQLQQIQAAAGQAGGAAAAGGAGVVGPGIGRTQLTSPGEASVTPLRLAVDRRTNSIIATGSKEDLQVVEALLVRLDTEGLASRITEVIWLRHATSTNVSTALLSFVTNQQSQQLRQTNTPGMGQASGIIDLLDRDLIVADEPVTNSLIISVAPRLYDSVRRIIDQLDRRPPMVLIKVILAEVTLSDGVEFGTELGLQDSLLYDRGVITGAGDVSTRAPGFNFNNVTLGNSNSNASQATRRQTGRQGLTSFLVGRTSETFGYGGFVLSAASDSVNLLMRALQDAGRAQILSRPQIMTLDNTEGLVLVGAKVPRIQNVSQGTTVSAPQLSIQDIEVGLILKVRPRVGADGLIIMEIDAIRSQVDTDPTTGIPVGFGVNGDAIISPQILTTQAQSTITAYSGQTVVYGGLIAKQRTQVSRRVPIISDIPILGMLFRFDSESERRTELLAVMTPMVVNSEQDLDYVKITESNRMSYCLSDVVEMHGPVGLSPGYGLWGPANGLSTIYPDLQPTVDDFPEDVRNGVQPYVPTEGIPEAAPFDSDGIIIPASPEQVPLPLESSGNRPSALGASVVKPAGYSNGPQPSSAAGPQVGDVIRFPVQ